MKKFILTLILALIVIGAIVAYYMWREFRPVDTRTPEEVVAQTIDALDPADPRSFLNIQDIIDLGEDGYDPLMSYADSDDVVTQWAVVVGLSNIRRQTPDPGQIEEVMDKYAESDNLMLRLYAATSNLELDLFKGAAVLVTSLESNEVVAFMEPAQPASAYANSVLEWGSGEDFGFDEAETEAEKQTAIAKWEEWLNNESE